MSVETFTKPPETSSLWEDLSPLDSSADYEEPERERESPEIADMRRRHEEIAADITLLAEGLGDSPLAEAAAGAIAKRSNDMLEVAKRAEAGKEAGLTLEETARAQRDLYFLLQSTLLAFGVRDTYEGLVTSDTMVTPLFRKSTGRGSRRFVYKTTTNTLYDEGDYDNLPAEDRREEMSYMGTLTVDINPESRISLAYRPAIDTAREFHTTHDVMRRGEKTVAHEFDDCNLRIDVDPKAPAGLAVDVGRSEYVSPTFMRESDLLGKVMKAADPEHGSHTYDEFTEDMRPEFTPMAEQLVAKLTLWFNEHEAEQQAQAAKEELDHRREQKKPFSEHDARLREVVAAQALHRRIQRERNREEGDRSRYTRGY